MILIQRFWIEKRISNATVYPEFDEHARSQRRSKNPEMSIEIDESLCNFCAFRLQHLIRPDRSSSVWLN